MPSSNVLMKTKKTHRKRIRAQRQSLPPAKREYANKHATRNLLNQPAIIKANHIAIYFASDGEIDPVFFHKNQQSKKSFYIPRVFHDRKMIFNHFLPSTGLFLNHFGIPEVSRGKRLHPKHLDVIILPLVAFDNTGNRLGMGGGFYDKALAFKKQAKWRQKPLLVGLAYEFQRLPCIETDRWDVPLDVIVTDQSVQYFNH